MFLLRFIWRLLQVAMWLTGAWLVFGLVGAMRWLSPEADPSPEAIFALVMRVVLLFGIFAILYTYESFFGNPPTAGPDTPLAGSHRDADKADKSHN